jgi:hypothetical protein
MKKPALRIAVPAALSLTAALAASPSSALDAAIVKGLLELDLGARLEQRCDIEAMTRIDKDSKTFSPDRVVAAATAEPKVDGNSIHGIGAAFRSKGAWYRLTYDCKTSDNHMDVLSFDYEIGDEIPEDKWSAFGLWD